MQTRRTAMALITLVPLALAACNMRYDAVTSEDVSIDMELVAGEPQHYRVTLEPVLTEGAALDNCLDWWIDVQAGWEGPRGTLSMPGHLSDQDLAEGGEYWASPHVDGDLPDCSAVQDYTIVSDTGGEASFAMHIEVSRGYAGIFKPDPSSGDLTVTVESIESE